MEYSRLLEELGARNPSVVVLDVGLATSMHTALFQKSFPERYFNLGIAEQNAVSVASGLGRRGLIPLVHSFSNFLARRAHDQIAISVCCSRSNVKLIGGSCGLYDARNGPSHTATDDLSAMASLPNMAVAEPGDQRQTRVLLDWLVARDGPGYLRLRRFGAAEDLLNGKPAEGGVCSVRRVHRPVMTVVACGTMLGEVLQTVPELDAWAVAADVMHVSILKPMHTSPLIEAAERSGLVVTVENHGPVGGFSDAVGRALGPLGVRHIRMCL